MSNPPESRPRPVIIANLIAAVLGAAVIVAVELGFVNWNAGQQAAVMGLVVAGINLGAALYSEQHVTPVESPMDDELAPLTRADGRPAIKR